jgi:mannosyltransferase OCH1-like enzyme
MIPRVIHRVWIGTPRPRWFERFGESWERKGWEVVTWDDRAVAGFGRLRNQTLWDRASEIAPFHVWQFRTDVFRYELLEQVGGVYVDADFELLTTIDDLMDPANEAWAAWETDNRWVNNAILAARAYHPLVRRMIDGMAQRVRAYPHRLPTFISGPRYLTEVYWRDRRRLTVYPQAWFYPYSWRELEEVELGKWGPEVRAVHHWNNKRRERGVPYAVTR